MPEPERAVPSALAIIRGFDVALAEANDPASLRALCHRVAVVQEMVKRLDAALEEQQRLAEFRIRVARKLGVVLAVTVQRGGRGSNGHEVSSIRGGSSKPLPPGISHKQSSRYQELARVPEDTLARYFTDARKLEDDIPTTKGLLRFAARDVAPSTTPRKPSGKSPKTPRQADPWNGAHHCLDLDAKTLKPVCRAVSRVLEVETTVGLPSELRSLLPQATHLDELQPSTLLGDVLLYASQKLLDAEASLVARAARESTQVVVLAPSLPHEPWFGALCEGTASVCFLASQPPSPPIAAIYLGQRHHAFLLVFARMGLVLRHFPA